MNTCRSCPCHNGTCVNQENSFQCHCEVGFTGQRCEQIIDNCLSQPCLNCGSCFNNVNSFSCSCRPGYSGQCCESLDCPAVCLNNGDCEKSYLNDLHQKFNISCVCKRGYSGKNCETVDTGVCLNGGSFHLTQTVNGWLNITCDCPMTYKGSFVKTISR